MSFLRDNALFVVIGWLAFGFLVALWFSRMAAHGEREVPTIYDVEHDPLLGTHGKLTVTQEATDIADAEAGF